MDDNKSSTKSKTLKELEKKLSMQRKQKSEELIKEKLDNKELDYDTASLILEVFGKSKFQWQTEHFDIFNLKPNEFRTKKLPNNYRECVMLGIRLGTVRSKMIYNLRDRPLSKKELQAMDDLIWSLVLYQWKEARMIYDFELKEKESKD